MSLSKWQNLLGWYPYRKKLKNFIWLVAVVMIPLKDSFLFPHSEGPCICPLFQSAWTEGMVVVHSPRRWTLASLDSLQVGVCTYAFDVLCACYRSDVYVTTGSICKKYNFVHGNSNNIQPCGWIPAETTGNCLTGHFLPVLLDRSNCLTGRITRKESLLSI